MFTRVIGITLLFGLMVLFGATSAQEPKTSGTVIGEVKAHKATKDGRNTMIEVLAPGEEKARSYHVMYDAKIKGPVPSILAAVRAAKVGERVELAWVGTNHGPAITSFKVLKKGGAAKEDSKEKK